MSENKTRSSEGRLLEMETESCNFACPYPQPFEVAHIFFSRRKEAAFGAPYLTCAFLT